VRTAAVLVHAADRLSLRTVSGTGPPSLACRPGGRSSHC
jgi:hypothetical protein